MRFNDHTETRRKLEDHAFLSASKYHWLNYDLDKLKESFRKENMKRKGTQLHELAERMISLGIKMEKNDNTLNMYVNDCIGHHMQVEQFLYFSKYAYGTADAINYNDKEKRLRIFDYKSGRTKTKFTQLYIYAAYFCLEYKVKPTDISFELRLYQNNECRIDEPTGDLIKQIMEKILVSNKVITSIDL